MKMKYIKGFFTPHNQPDQRGSIGPSSCWIGRRPHCEQQALHCGNERPDLLIVTIRWKQGSGLAFGEQAKKR